METLLVFGYIRSIELLISPKIIPLSIFDLCSSYYSLIRLLLYFAVDRGNDRTPHGLYIANMDK